MEFTPLEYNTIINSLRYHRDCLLDEQHDLIKNKKSRYIETKINYHNDIKENTKQIMTINRVLKKLKDGLPMK